MSGYGSSGYGLGPYGYTPIFDGLDMGIQVLLDDGTGTFPYDVTTYVRVIQGWTIQRGRQDELSTVTAGSLSLTLDNADGRFSLGSTLIASPSPIKVDARIRVMETANATTFTRFTGYVVSWPVAWPSGGDGYSTVTITAMDAQARAERWVLKSMIEEEILPDLPAALYRLDELAGATGAGDSSGNRNASLVMMPNAGIGTPNAPVTFGATGLSSDGPTAAQFELNGQLLSAQLTAPCTNGAFEFWFSTTYNSANLEGVFSANTSPTSGGYWVYLQNGALTVAPGIFVADGVFHHYVHTYAPSGNQTWIDGQLVATGGGGVNIGVLVVGSDTVTTFPGTIAYAAVYPAGLSSARIAAHYAAGRGATESETARITRLAGYAGLPVGTFDSSLTNVPSINLSGKSAWDAIQEVADAGMGVAFFDGSGNLTFHNRNRAAGKTAPDLTIDAEYLDEGTAFTVDMQGALNYFEVTAAGTKVTQVAKNATSETSHGRYPGSASYLVQTDQEALDRGNWIVSNHAEPAPRVGSLTIDLLTMSAAQQAAMLALEPDTWLRVTNLPGQTPGGTTADFIVQGFTEALNDAKWTIDANVVSKSLTDCLILDDATRATLDSGNRLYV